MTPRFITRLLLFFLFVSSGCTRPAPTRQDRTAEPYLPASGSVVFDISSFKDQNGSISFEATHTSPGKIARFAVEFGPARKVESKGPKDFSFATGRGRFLAEAGSDATALLSDLKKALEAKTFPGNVRRVKELPFTYVNFGDSLSQAPNGGFNASPPGNWSANKIFVGEEGQDVEVFVNFNATIGKGQFSIKDPDYGDLVLKELARVL